MDHEYSGVQYSREASVSASGYGHSRQTHHKMLAIHTLDQVQELSL